MRTVAIVNQKGGCGKTTTAINLAALYAKRGLRTLLVDMDPQSHCAAGLGVPESRIEYSIGDALVADLAPGGGFDAATLTWEVARNLHLAPSTVMLSALEAPGGGLHQLPDKDRRLESLLACVANQYDRCLIDCPPTIGLLTFNALRACREALIPVETGFFSLRGAEKQWNTIQRMISHIGRPIACHLLPTLHNPQSQLSCNILAALRRQFAGQIIPVVIHEDEALREAASFGQPVQEYAPESGARRDFEALADWLEEHASRPSVQIEILASQDGVGGIHTGLQHDGHSGDSLSPHSGGGRAAELARRMHGLNGRANATAPSISASRVAPASESIDSSVIAVQESPTAPQIRPIEFEIQIAADPTHIETETEVASTESEPAETHRVHDLSHLYGVRQTSRGVLFIQPADMAERVSIVGDFNFWNVDANPMRFDESNGVLQAIIELAPGTHQYCLIADGQWLLDPHNPNTAVNSYGEPNSVVVSQPLS